MWRKVIDNIGSYISIRPVSLIGFPLTQQINLCCVLISICQCAQTLGKNSRGTWDVFAATFVLYLLSLSTLVSYHLSANQCIMMCGFLTLPLYILTDDSSPTTGIPQLLAKQHLILQGFLLFLFYPHVDGMYCNSV